MQGKGQCNPAKSETCAKKRPPVDTLDMFASYTAETSVPCSCDEGVAACRAKGGLTRIINGAVSDRNAVEAVKVHSGPDLAGCKVSECGRSGVAALAAGLWHLHLARGRPLVLCGGDGRRPDRAHALVSGDQDQRW